MNKTYQNEISTEDEKEKRQNEADKEKSQNLEIEKRTNLRKIEESLKKPFLPPQTTTSTKFGDLRDRTVWTVLMLMMFTFVILLGNFYCALLVVIIMSLIFSELIDLSTYKERNQELKNYYLWNWYTIKLRKVVFLSLHLLFLCEAYL